MNKSVLKEHWDEILVKEYQSYGDNCVKYTSGSTGTPFKMVMDKYKHCRWIAANKIFRDNVGVRSHEKAVFISETIADKNISMDRQERDNIFYLDCRYLDGETINDLLAYFIEKKVRSLTALASALDKMARLIREGKMARWEGEFLAIFSVSETLKESTRKTVSDYFRCPVYVLYAKKYNYLRLWLRSQ